MTHDPLICWDDVSVHYGERRAVDGITLHIGPGEVVGLLGMNGAGKTTMLNTAIGVLAPSTGEVRRRGAVALGFMPQEYAFFPQLSGAENLRYFAGAAGLSGPAVKAEVGRVLRLVGLAERCETRADALSGGLKRRLSMAIAVLGDPQVLILDEPTVGVDPESRDMLHRLIREAAAEGRAVLMSSHYIDEVERLSDRVAVLDGGRLVAEGAPTDLCTCHGRSWATVVVDGVGERFFDDLRALLPPPAEVVAEPQAGSSWEVELLGAAGIGSVDLLSGIIALAADRGAGVTDIRLGDVSLEAAFRTIVGRPARAQLVQGSAA